MEPRLMLAADAGAAVQATTSAPSTTDANIAQIESTAFQVSANTSSPTLVIIDRAVSEDFDFEAAIPSGADLIVLDPSRDAIGQISAALAGRSNLTSVHLISHGQSGQIQLGNEQIDAKSLADRSVEIGQWGRAFANGGDFLIYGCDVASDQAGKLFLNQFAALTGLDVAASTDATGAGVDGSDWVLESTIGQVQTVAMLDANALNRFSGTLAIQITAAGDLGDEIMQLQIGDQVVQEWTMAGTNAANGLFGQFEVNLDGVNVDDIRVNFINDEYDLATNRDRNVRVDQIVVDGVTYKTDNPAVYSDGSYRTEDGLVEGFGRGDYLTVNGGFQYSTQGASTGDGIPDDSNTGGTNIQIDARGDTGQEIMQLLIDGQVAQTIENVSTTQQTYSFDVAGDVTADRIQVAFTNDLYQPDQNYDRNLIVDRIRVNGQVFETEAPSTRSTGFVDDQGVRTGYFQNEVLWASGAFQYLADGSTPDPDPDPNPPNGGEGGSFVLAEDFASVFENESSVTLTINRVGGSEGEATVQYSTESETATDGSDFTAQSGTLVFASGEISQSVTIPILEDADAEGTESFSFRLLGSENASLLAPRTATVNILDNDQALPSYSSFDSADGLQVNRNASVNNGNLQLTGAGPNQRGSAFYTTPINVDANTSFQAAFASRFTGGQGAAGGEGLAFQIQNSPGGLAGQDIGNYPGGLGYNASANTIGIELDTFKNSYEQFADEITITLNGVMINPERTIQSPYNLNDGQLYYTWVDYNGESDSLAVYISDSNEKPEFALMKTSVRLNEIVGDQAYLGFSAATGGAYNNTLIESWNVTLDAPNADPQTLPTGEIIQNSLYGGLNQPLNIEWSPDGRNLYVGEKAGIIKVSRDGGDLTTVIDISNIVNDAQDRGLVDFEINPDFENNPYIYLNFTFDPPEVYDNIGNPLAGPDGSGNRAGRLIRLTLDASTNYTTVVPFSGITLLGSNSTWDNFNAFTDSTLNLNESPAGLNPDGSYIQDFINSDSRSHTVGGLAFGTDGALYVGIGDGASFNATDPRALRVQDVNSLSGKILRIDPNTGQGLSDNPFYDGNPDSNRSKVYQLGLRNPWRLAVDAQSGQLYIGETGLVSFEEINAGGPGANFGWPFYEGGQGVNRRTPSYQGLPQAQAFYNSGQGTPAFIAQPHTNGTDVIVLGSVTDGLNYGPQYDGDIFYADFASGTVRVGDTDANGNLASVGTFTTGAAFAVDIQQGPDGFLYYVDIVSGTVGRFEIV